jgi:tRNA pseudouridine55 synthase
MNGILVINKPVGMTSHDVVSRSRRLLSERRIGHTGTLDPFATGVLVLMVGRATRLAQFLNTDEKEYRARIRFGFATDTGDLTGTPLEPVFDAAELDKRVERIDASQLENAIAQLRGEIDQLPPMYSAKKIKGRKLYELAREGREVERKAVQVTIREFEVIHPPDQQGRTFKKSGDLTCFTRSEDGEWELDVRVVCSAGTYIRTLAESLGALLGVPAHLSVLDRTRAGNFNIEQSVTLECLENAIRQQNDISSMIITPSAALPEMPFMHLNDGETRVVLNGGAITARGFDYEWENKRVNEWDKKEDEYELKDKKIRLLDEGGELLAVGEIDRHGEKISPRVVLVTESKV